MLQSAAHRTGDAFLQGLGQDTGLFIEKGGVFGLVLSQKLLSGISGTAKQCLEFR